MNEQSGKQLTRVIMRGGDNIGCANTRLSRKVKNLKTNKLITKEKNKQMLKLEYSAHDQKPTGRNF